jgi:hypothetical protein
MGFVFTIAAGLVIWLVLWSLNAKAIDAFMITALIVVLAATARMLVPFLPGRDE